VRKEAAAAIGQPKADFAVGTGARGKSAFEKRKAENCGKDLRGF
jgi:hypothetical protein